MSKEQTFDDTFIQVRVFPHHKVDLDEVRRLEPDIPTRSEMVRRLIERAAASVAKKGKR